MAERFFATAAKGTEGALRDELRALGLRRVKATRGGVGFEGGLDAGMRACMGSRIAQRILLEVGTGPAPDADALYETVQALAWEDHLDTKHSFAVQATGKTERLRHTGFTALKVKDAVVDRLRDRIGGRPDVDPKGPDVLVVVHLARQEASLYLDMAGETLHRRGWRREGGEAPLKETLAAAVLALGAFDPERPLCDPMCGSGTMAIEAALVARHVAPGLGRRFGFERWPAFGDEGAASLRALADEARAAALPSAPAPILARDRFPAPLDAARQNAKRAGVEADVAFEQRDVRSLGPLPDGCQIFVNPPYGERLGKKRLQLEGLFRQMGEAYRALEGDHPLVVLAGAPGFEAAFGKPSRPAHTLFNGPLRVRLLRYGPAGGATPNGRAAH